ncbi:MAG: AAA family ATPase [Chlorobiaceae bacterium]
MTVKIKNFAIAGYRSFGKDPQYFDNFEKVNLFIGRNNSGKSNIIRFINEIISKYSENKGKNLDPLVYHLPDRSPLLIGSGEKVLLSETDKSMLAESHRLVAGISIEDIYRRNLARQFLAKILNEKCRIDNTELCWSFMSLPSYEYTPGSWSEAIKVLSDCQAKELWNILISSPGRSLGGHWNSEIINLLYMPQPAVVNVAVIPAIRQIGTKGSISDGFDGTGIIERLARLQNPDVHNQEDKRRFSGITDFLRTVIDNPDASIEIPHDRATILIHMDGKVLPVESMGSGIHEVLILASAATVLNEQVVCIEEPEIHLNPILQRKFIRYLTEHTTNQYFITTHSATLMDNVGVEIYHVRLQDSVSVVERVTSDTQRSTVCEDLGYHPSDLLQANCVIWVEGPSDRVYVNHWIKGLSAELVEGVHYSIMFYGGRLASHLSNEDYSTEVDNFISLRRLNRRGVIILDSDKEKPRSCLNETKKRLQREFDKGPGHSWVTDGKEIENYISADQLRDAIKKKCPNASTLTTFDKYDNCLRIKNRAGKEIQAPKIEIARYVINNYVPDFSVLDLKQRMNKLLVFIRESNPNQNI